MKPSSPIMCFRLFAKLCLLFGCVATAFAQEPREPTAEDRQQHLQRMRAVAESIHLFDGTSGKRVEIALTAEPALRYADNTRRTYDSTVWFWGAEGRPQAALAIEYYPLEKRGPQWLFELVSLSDHKLAAERSEWSWQAKQPGIALRPIPDAPEVAEKPALRLAQLKQLQRRFSSYEIAQIGGRISLRPLANPLRRYSDPKADIVDGAVFTFANGTNPELLLVIEARQSPPDTARWFYGMAQMSGAEIVGVLDDKEVWRQPNADPVAVRDSYVNGWIPASTTEVNVNSAAKP
jgi:hypothetical protein